MTVGSRASVFNHYAIYTQLMMCDLATVCCSQESPVHTLSSLDSLLSMASKKGKRECILAVGELLLQRFNLFELSTVSSVFALKHPND